MPTPEYWRAPWIWRAQLRLAAAAVAAVARLRVTGEVPEHLRRGPLILAANHISPLDPAILSAACGTRDIAPRIMATGGLFRAPVVGSIMRASGHIRVDRATTTVARALDAAAAAVAAGSVVLVYPEGRIGLDPGLWPERGKTGAARLALASGAVVIPVAQWGAHELIPYDTTVRGVLRGLGRAVRRRPPLRVHFGDPVELSGLTLNAPGHAQRGTERIIEAITATLRPLRPDEPDLPRHLDPTRPTNLARSSFQRRRDD